MRERSLPGAPGRGGRGRVCARNHRAIVNMELGVPMFPCALGRGGEPWEGPGARRGGSREARVRRVASGE